MAEPIPAPVSTPAPNNAPTPAPAAAPKAEDIAAALLTALETRQQRTERSVAKSFSEQYGLSETEISDILAKAKAEKEAKIPEAAQAEITKQLERANGLLIAADVRAKGAALGLVDADTALLLLDESKIKVDDKGVVTGTEEALKDLQSSKAYLFAAQPTGQKGIVGGKIDNPNPGGEPDGVTAAFLRRNPGMKL